MSPDLLYVVALGLPATGLLLMAVLTRAVHKHCDQTMAWCEQMEAAEAAHVPVFRSDEDARAWLSTR